MVSHSYPITLVVLRTLEEIRAHRPVWSRLCQHRDADPDFFEFFLLSRPSASPYVLLVEAQATQALILGRLETDKLNSRFGYVKVGSPRLRVLELIPGGVLGDIDAPSARVVAAHLDDVLRSGQVDMIRLHYADVLSPLYMELALTHPFRFSGYRAKKTMHRLRKVSATSTTFGETISGNERSNQRRRERRLVKEYQGDVRIESYCSAALLTQLMDDAERVASRSYQRALGVGFSSTEDTRRRLEFLADHGWLSAWLLYLANKPVAFWIGAVRDGVFFSDYLAYDSRYSDVAPGAYLTVKVLESMHHSQAGVHWVDFGPGDAPYKARFGTESRTVASVNMFALTWRGICAHVLDDLTTIASIIAKAALKKLDAFDPLKRAERRRVLQGSLAKESSDSRGRQVIAAPTIAC